ncbi:regulator of chromosome condensation 1/beta-lactamase-inhibitor protein II [Mycotypha africana]|uniref:regulator of chromosome condensation 1/beta-lactamase-inhibitor protein II n=1 Tax=Mycotypha africana TaxID=64632 RepID=UPI0023013DA3|nr:regulator of chromosome condensation 1/beta-lactamase-inhibitor protein II [Mycotypha africana]KAI8979663.1 regulator of chromosome condensation 1/beta-lactamase-inhibitor protein II [Mycotypha africana]
MQQEELRLYAFGFNGFKQIDGDSTATIISSPKCYVGISKVLYVGWETTILMDAKHNVLILGFKPAWFSRFESACANRKLKSVFGDPNKFLGFVDEYNNLSIITEAPENSEIDILSNIVKAVFCQHLDTLILLDTYGQVQQCRYNNIKNTIEPISFLSKVKDLCASKSHVLFATSSNDLPIYGMGSNRLSQLGIDYHELQASDTPTLIEYFCGLNLPTNNIACGPFHSAVVRGNELYTFGWSKDGRLGWGSNNENNDGDIVSLSSFLDCNDQPVILDNDNDKANDSLSIKQTACGTNHTVAIDEKGRVWTCGSNKYGQLGRNVIGDVDKYFKECRLFNINSEKAIDCYAGNWSTFILTKALN